MLRVFYLPWINLDQEKLRNKVYILVGNLQEAKLLMLLKELDKNKSIIDGILVEKLNQRFIDKIVNRMGQFIHYIKSKIIGGFLNQIPLEIVQNSWGIKNLNSWNLLNIEDDPSRLLSEIKVIQSFEVNAQSFAKLKSDSGEVLVAIYAGGFFNDSILELDGVHLLNAHMGRMPNYRGMAAIEWAVLNDEIPYVSVMKVAKSIDGGDVLAEYPIDISTVSTIGELRKVGYEYCIQKMASCLIKYKNVPIEFNQQLTAGKYHYRMHPKIIEKVELKIKELSR